MNQQFTLATVVGMAFLVMLFLVFVEEEVSKFIEAGLLLLAFQFVIYLILSIMRVVI